jgi:hypothetical protein
MKRVIIICEGQTEQSFCNDVLKPYFNPLGIALETPTIKRTRGGIVRWQILSKQIEQHLTEDKTALVTTLIDYYGLHERHGFPNWNEAEQTPDKSERMNMLEQGMKNNVHEDLKYRFIPYIQLHEFEGILFSDITAFDKVVEKSEFTNYNYLKSTIEQNSNPELIHKGTETAPSKRLSPCDMGRVKNAKKLNPRARQNVILELGYFLGKLGRPRVCALKKSEVEDPSDFTGVVYVPFDEQNGWQTTLARELKTAGYSVDLNVLLDEIK